MKCNRLFSALAAMILAGTVNINAQTTELGKILNNPNRRIVETTGLPDINNHDVSNIIYHGGEYHLWITEHYSRQYEG